MRHRRHCTRDVYKRQLLHDVYKTSVQAALEIVDCLQEEGYEFVTVDELMLE